MNQSLFELKEVHPKCGSHYEMQFGHAFIVCCPKCDKYWNPCESALKQYRQWCEIPLQEIPK